MFSNTKFKCRNKLPLVMTMKQFRTEALFSSFKYGNWPEAGSLIFTVNINIFTVVEDLACSSHSNNVELCRTAGKLQQYNPGLFFFFFFK